MKLIEFQAVKAWTAFILVMASVFGLGLVIIAAVFISLPDIHDLKKCLTTKMNQVYLCENSPNFIKLSEISPYILGAVLMSEDASFYSHEGLDYVEMKESLIKDLNEGRFARGASTITQQLAKNVFLTKRKTIIRKLEEIYLALQIEKVYSKAQILTYYLNVVELGHRIYGVKAASQFYFRKTPSQVTPEEAAFLAFLLPNPNKHSQSFYQRKLTPFAEKTLKKILHKMHISKKISDEEHLAAMERLNQFPWAGAATAIFEGQQIPPGGPSLDESTEDDEFRFDFEDDEAPEPPGSPSSPPPSTPTIHAPPSASPEANISPTTSNSITTPDSSNPDLSNNTDGQATPSMSASTIPDSAPVIVPESTINPNPIDPPDSPNTTDSVPTPDETLIQ